MSRQKSNDEALRKMAGMVMESSWAELLDRAMSSLDEEDVMALEKRRESAKRKLARRSSAEMPFDEQKVKAFLLKYSIVGKYSETAESIGVKKAELLDAYDFWPESRVVYDYVVRRRKQAREIENDEILEDARNGLRRLVTVEGCELDQKSVLFAIERLDRKSFGRDAVKEGGGNVQVNYHLPGLTINMIQPPDGVLAKLHAKKKTEVIDV